MNIEKIKVGKRKIFVQIRQLIYKIRHYNTTRRDLYEVC